MDDATIRALLKRLEALERTTVRARLGEVTDGSPLDVTLGGADTIIEDAPRLASAGRLTAGDPVAALTYGNALLVLGRVDDVLNVAGHRIGTMEVESALDEHPAVDLAGVVGIHDEVHGESVRAYVTLRDDEPKPSSAELIVFCRERIGYKAPEEVIFLKEMPLNPTGKIDRVGLKAMAEDHLHPHLG